MKKGLFLSLIFAVALIGSLPAQQITYSDPDRDDLRNTNYEIIGKLNDNFLVYKNYRDVHYIAVYDQDMKMTAKQRIDNIPDRIFNADFLAYPDFFYMFYQFQKRNVVYCMAQKIGPDGKNMGDPVQLDTTNLAFAASNKIYTVLNSEDKQKILVFKINSKNDKLHYVTTVEFDKDMQLLHRSVFGVNMPERNDFLTEFQVDNDGDIAFVRAWGTAQNDNITRLSLLTKPLMSDVATETDLRITNLYLDDVRLKVDNANKHYLITSFYSKQRRGNIEGLYSYMWDKNSAMQMFAGNTIFSDELRAEAKGENSVKGAFNDYFLQNIIMRKDGGFLIAAESVYTSSRGSNLSRWDYLYGSPFLSPYNYYYGSGFGWGGYYYPWYRYGYGGYGNITRYYADDIAVLSFGNDGKMEWSNIIQKSQYDDNSDNFIGYGLINTGDQLHFFFNVPEKRQQIFSEQNISPDGQLTRVPTLKNLDRGYDFMPRQAKQTGLRQFIVPVQYRTYTCFAKVEL